VTTTVVDYRRAQGSGRRRVTQKDAIDKQPAAGAMHPSKNHIRDGRVVRRPASRPHKPRRTSVPPQPPGGCVDEIKAAQNASPKVLGFPISYLHDDHREDGKPNVVAMEITELEIRRLDIIRSCGNDSTG